MTLSDIEDSGWSEPTPSQTVSFGIPIADALPEALQRLSARRVAVITTNSLVKPDGLAWRVRDALGSRFHTITSEIRPHTRRADVMRVLKALEGADGVVTIGGGSVCDAVKAARLCLANGVTDAAGMDRFRTFGNNPGGEGDTTLPATLPFVAIPTTLSAAEFTPAAGVTDERGPMKQIFMYPGVGADIVILDPAMTRQTPSRLFFATGMRAVDHAVEIWCSINPNPVSDAYSLYAGRMLISSLRRVFEAPDDMQARLNCQKGAWLSVRGATGTVKAGASHGLGHALGGTGGMVHGETTCVMLPHVLRYNAPVNGERQAVIASSVGEGHRALADIIESLVADLGLPGRLRDAGVAHALLDDVAAAALHDPMLATNPRPLRTLAEIRQFLEQAW